MFLFKLSFRTPDKTSSVASYHVHMEDIEVGVDQRAGSQLQRERIRSEKRKRLHISPFAVSS
jgi:hypothetical protein